MAITAHHTDTIEELFKISGFDVLPPTDNVWSIGSVAKSLKDIHVQNIVYATAIAGTLSPSADNTYDLGESSTPSEWKDLYLDGVAYVDEIQMEDSEKIRLGTGQDAEVFYDGTNLQINPRAVGSGAVVLGDGEGGVVLAADIVLRGPNLVSGAGDDDVAGADFYIQGALGRGSGDVGQIIFQTGQVAAADTVQTYETILTLDEDLATFAKAVQFDSTSITLASGVNIDSAGAINIRPSGDTDDYLSITTAADVVTLTATGSSFNLVGDVETDDLLLSGGITTHAATPVNYRGNILGGSFTSGGASDAAVMTYFGGGLTAAVGDTGLVTGADFSANIIMQTATETVAKVAQVYINEPNINDSGLDGDITVAASLYVGSAPTEGLTNAAIYVANGVVNLQGGLLLGDAQTIEMGDTGAINTGTATADYYTLGAFDTGATVVEVARAQGATDPYFSMGGSQEFKFYNSGAATVAAAVNIVLGDGVNLQTGVAVNDFYDLEAYDADDTTYRSVARVQGGVNNPYFSTGASQQYKFYATGGADFGGNATVLDDVQIRFGTNTDYWLTYNSTGTQLELWTTNADGGGTDGIIFSVDDGTDDVDFTGGITVGGNSVFADAATIEIGAAGVIKSGATNGDTMLLASNDTTFITFTTGATDTLDIGAFTLSGKLTAGATEIEGSAFDIDGGDISAVTVSGSLTWSATQDFGANLATFGSYILLSSNQPAFRFTELDQAVGSKNWEFGVSASNFQILSLDDAWGTPVSWLSLDRDAGFVFHKDLLINDTLSIQTGTAVDDYFTLEAYDTTGAGRVELIRIANNAGTPGKLGFWGVTPVVQPSAYTQTYATADKTIANPTCVSMGDLVATEGGWGASSEANFDKITTAIDQIIADNLDLRQALTALVDDLQALGLLQ